jgi:hypothetical protein
MTLDSGFNVRCVRGVTGPDEQALRPASKGFCRSVRVRIICARADCSVYGLSGETAGAVRRKFRAEPPKRFARLSIASLLSPRTTVSLGISDEHHGRVGFQREC